MTSGYVDRQWAKHHYSRWYREHFENTESISTDRNNIIETPQEDPFPSLDNAQDMPKEPAKTEEPA
jgi:hypothetical protein